MSDASTKEEQNAAFLLVGEFLYHWNYLEYRIGEGIKLAVQGQSMQELDVMLANVGFRDKVSMLNTFAHILLEPWNKSVLEEAKSLFGRITNFGGMYRNVLMHNPIIPVKGGIEIGRVRAKGKFERPFTFWNADFFEARFKEIDAFDYELYQVLRIIEVSPRPKDFPGLLSPKPQWETPIQDIYAREFFGLPYPQLQDSTDSLPQEPKFVEPERNPGTEPPSE